MRFARHRTSDPAIIHQCASICLGYPDDEMMAMVPLLDAALGEQPADVAITALRSFVGHLRESEPKILRQQYIDIFDLSRKHTLYLSYWTAGDTRRRGEELGAFKRHYRDSGFLVDLRGELPDHLPIVLEFAARVDRQAGVRLLQEHRPALELLRLSLVDLQTPYADVVAAVCATLPGESPADRRAVMAMQGAPPPTESVGLEPFDPRLLPIAGTR
ncbi:nitrate reductase molybdenum cofactor assembly chaperone [Gordonia sp. SL306]|uniref:nitrate reductase molybdenum cofactor assembly chaperone n=1 Tax=Gordonia sp. SL306 TaxID=2995145 RepID=UPI00226D69A8|nr:nitrate reductase molybdenum cofactor assembly chaperone [Gordonia sp. SL306]WAC56466.1 nitrate reductase molybdenum cofactor assembly chaperone [Gordonia sp. SL306]